MESTGDKGPMNLVEPPLAEKPAPSSVEGKDLFSGRRIIDLPFFLDQIKEMDDHPPFGCSFKDMTLVKETRYGYRSTLEFRCNMCNITKRIDTSRKENDKNDINEDAVMGTLCAGIGYSQLEEVTNGMNIPCMSSKTFIRVHNRVCENFEEVSLDMMKEAAEEEARMARENGEVDNDGVPLVTVICDGSWGKRSYKTMYNSASGTATIIGQRTKKILYLGVRNKYCMICARNKSSNENTEKEHLCFKNWNTNHSSSGMEASIIVEGFKKSEEMYGIRYAKFIADGDSSVYKKILDARPYSNRTVEKIECRNHLLRNFCNKLKDLTKNKIYGPLNHRRILAGKILKMRQAVVMAIRYRKKDKNTEGLRQDILNAPNHILGNHNKCAEYFCKGPKENEKDMKMEMIASGFMKHIENVVQQLSINAKSLIEDLDSNIVESYNAIIAKCISGKRINYSLRGSNTGRCHVAAIFHNTGRPMQRYKLKLKKKLGYFTELCEERRLRRVKNTRAHRILKGRKRKLTSGKVDDKDYGEATQKPDMAEDIFEEQKTAFLNSLPKTDQERKNIERKTINQKDSNEWKELRRRMLTASKFGEIVRMQLKTSCVNKVKDLLYGGFDGNYKQSCQWGIMNEENAIKAMENEIEQKIDRCGLFIDSDRPYLGASPDGLIGDDGLVEVKCPWTAREMTISQGIEKKEISFWKVNKDGKIEINKIHKFYYQIQGQLNISKRDYCMFGMWTTKDFKAVRIDRDENFWTNEMIPKLEIFYLRCLLPEIIDPRHTRSMPIRNPDRN